LKKILIFIGVIKRQRLFKSRVEGCPAGAAPPPRSPAGSPVPWSGTGEGPHRQRLEGGAVGGRVAGGALDPGDPAFSFRLLTMD